MGKRKQYEALATKAIDLLATLRSQLNDGDFYAVADTLDEVEEFLEDQDN